MIYRKLIVISYIIPALLFLLMRLKNFVYEPIIAIFGIATIITIVFSPVLFIMAIYGFKLSSQFRINILFLCLGTLHLFTVSIGIYKIWPQLMGV
jgi:hypothetical protein